MQPPHSGSPYSSGPPSQQPQQPQSPYGPAPSPQPWGYGGTTPPPARGVPVWVWIGLAVGVVGMFVLVGVFAIGMALGARSGSSASADRDPPSAAGARGGATSAPATNLPKPSRNVPVHSTAILQGCSTRDIDLITSSIGAAIDVGAPTYNAGDFQGCYTTYDHAALKLEAALSSSCRGPATALSSGRATARGKLTPADRAWAMRDTFDGLSDVIDRAN